MSASLTGSRVRNGGRVATYRRTWLAPTPSLAEEVPRGATVALRQGVCRPKALHSEQAPRPEVAILHEPEQDHRHRSSVIHFTDVAAPLRFAGTSKVPLRFGQR